MTPELHQEIARQRHAELVHEARVAGLAELGGRRQNAAAVLASGIRGLLTRRGGSSRPQPNVLRPA